MRVLVVLVIGAPKERPYTTCTLDGAVWEVHRYHHLLVDFGFKAYDMWGESFGMLRILLETVNRQPCSAPKFLRAHSHQSQ